jgi:hypothetical protein
MHLAAEPRQGLQSGRVIRHFAVPENVMRSQHSQAIVEGHP